MSCLPERRRRIVSGGRRGWRGRRDSGLRLLRRDGPAFLPGKTQLTPAGQRSPNSCIPTEAETLNPPNRTG
ncbi:MAG: hypothetical protein MZV63_64620 [Marinilabiliales bacterium]|nr:hypothetical protein [Marinilabiliales bacterium]